MSANIKVFISYRNTTLSRMTGTAIYDLLTLEHGFTVFFDQEQLKPEGGTKWDEALLNNVRASDVLLLLLEQTTHESRWVQRELDVARGANISIVPLIVDEANKRDIEQNTLPSLDLGDLQYLTYGGLRGDHNNLIRSLYNRAEETRLAQGNWIEQLAEHRRTKPFAGHEINSSYARFRHGSHPVLIHLGTGDATRMTGYEAGKGIDVIVNTENNYMQMARIYESWTVSSQIRRKGAYIVAARIREDTVQVDLDHNIQFSEHQYRPVQPSQVVITRAGHPKSELHKQGFRFVFHVATVEVSHLRGIEPIPADGLREAALNCLRHIEIVNQQRGAVTLIGQNSDGAPQYLAEEIALAENYQPIESIVMPLFGSGRHSRITTLEVVPLILDSIIEFLQTEYSSQHTLRHIHIAIFSKADLTPIQQLFAERLTPVD